MPAGGMMAQDGDAASYLDLADWRRRITELYAQVRDTATVDPVAAWERWRAVRDALYREHPQSPVPAERRADYRGRYFPYDPAFRFAATIIPLDTAEGAAGDTPLAIPTSGGGTMGFRRLGRVTVPFPDGPRRLLLSWLTDYAGGLFLSFRDGTNGAATYGGGRYLLDTAKGADLGGDAARGTIVLDFNFAYQPSCAFDPRWICPLVPPENRLDFPLAAGERLA